MFKAFVKNRQLFGLLFFKANQGRTLKPYTMKKNILSLLFGCALYTGSHAQFIVTPISTSNYNFDAVAENTTAAAHTTGAIDGSDYVMFSQAYASLYSITSGLPNNGIISANTRTYQLQPYNQNNILFLTPGQTDSILFNTPASYPAISALGLATEGNGTVHATVRFTDNSTQIFNNVSVLDWFNGIGNMVNSFGRANRSAGTISNPTGAPNLYPFDFNLLCANRSKLVKNIKFQNVSTNARICIMAVSGAASSTITTSSNPVTCSGGTNGSASVTIVGGTGPFTYSWTTSPAQTGAQANGLPIGAYTVTVTDAGTCAFTATASVSQSIVTQPPLNVSSSGTNICAGSTVAIGVSGAATYTWSNGSNQSILLNLAPTTNTTYTVSGHTSANCLLTGSISIIVNPIPVLNINGLSNAYCINSATVTLNGSPSGGVFSGLGVYQGVFTPSNAGVGTATVVYSYTDAANCSATSMVTLGVNALPNVSFSLSNNSFCKNNPGYTLTPAGSPAGGTFSGPGVSSPVFHPSVAGVGSFSLTYKYSDANGCSDSAVVAVSVASLAAPSLTLSKSPSFCLNSPNTILQVSPNGGTFSGTGLSQTGVFSPSVAGVGTHTLSYSITSAPCTESSAITVTVNSCAGLGENTSLLIELFPNPNNGEFVIRGETNAQIKIYNLSGQLIHNFQLHEENRYQINVTNLSEGLYVVKSESEGKVTTQKIIVLR